MPPDMATRKNRVADRGTQFVTRSPKIQLRWVNPDTQGARRVIGKERECESKGSENLEREREGRERGRIRSNAKERTLIRVSVSQPSPPTIRSWEERDGL